MKKSQREILDSSRQITRRGLMLAGIQVATVTTLALKMPISRMPTMDSTQGPEPMTPA